VLTPGIYARALALKEVFQSLPKPEVLVDAGCGSGFHLLQIDATRKIGLDIHPSLQRDIQCIKCDLRFIPLKSKACDFLMSLDVIEHIEEDAEVVFEFRRVLDDGGVLVITTPNDSDFIPYRPLRVMFGLDTSKIHRWWGHVRPGYSRGQLTALVERNGFEVIYYGRIGGSLVRVLGLGYILLLKLGEHIYSPEQRVQQFRKGVGLTRRLERTHDFLFSLLLAPIIKRLEKRGDKGFWHLIACRRS